MRVSHDQIRITITPDDYHIRCAGRTRDGRQVFVTADLEYDAAASRTTDFIVVYTWDRAGDFMDAQVTTLGVRGEYDPSEAARLHERIQNGIEGLTLDTIRVKPCRIVHDGIEFGLIPRTDDGFTVVELMPGNTLCFLEPFDGEYDT